MRQTAEALQAIHLKLADLCCEIEDCFNPGAKVTVLVRNPGADDKEPHSAAVIATNDSMEQIQAALAYLKAREEMHL